MKYILTLFLMLPQMVFAESLIDRRLKERVLEYFWNTAESVQSQIENSGEKIPFWDFSLINVGVSDEKLIDNRNSLVDAIGVPGNILLYKESWLNFMKGNIDIRLLVIHELLRASAVNDDDYRVSFQLFSNFERITREGRVYCNLFVGQKKKEIRKKKFKAYGIEALNSSGVLVISGGSSGPSFERARKNLMKKCREKGYYGFEYIRGNTIYSRSMSNGFQRNEIKTLIEAYCLKDVYKKKSRSARRSEACEKASICKKTLENSGLNESRKRQWEELIHFTEENKC